MPQRIAAISIDRTIIGCVDLVSLIEQRCPTRFGKPSGNGTKRTVKGPCPWCGGTDRFAVFVNEIPQRYYCGIHGNSGCNNRQGDAIQFLRDYEHTSFKEAYAELTGTDIPQATQATYNTVSEEWKSKEWQEKAARFCAEAEKLLWEDESKGFDVLVYLFDRGFTEKTIKGARLGAALYNDALCLVIPWFDSKQSLYYRVELRDINPNAENRYKNYSGSSVRDGMYGADSLLFNRPSVFLVEGTLDALSIAQEASDLVSVVSTGSTGGSHNPKWLMRLSNVPRVFVAFDSEEKGEKSAAYWLNALPNATRWRTPIGKDANEMLVRELDIRVWVESALSTRIEPEAITTVNIIEEPRSTRVFDESIPVELAQLVTGLEESTGTDWHVRTLPKGFTLADRVSELNRQHAEQEKESERAMMRTGREARAYTGMPRWLIPGTEDWNIQVARSGQREMLQRRQAWFNQQETSRDAVLAEAL